MHDDVPTHLAKNLKQLRQARGLTQLQLSKMSGVPRPTWAHLETGAANPTLAVLLRVAEALRVTIEELIAPPRAMVRRYPAGSLLTKNRNGVEIRKLLPDPVPNLEIDRLALPAGARMTGAPHTPGTREYLACESGEIELIASEEAWRLGPGDVLVFRGDQKHSYVNPGRGPAVGYSVVALAPLGF